MNLDFHVQILPLTTVALVNFVFSWTWYSPVLFAKPWAKALGIDMGKPMSDVEKKRMPFLFGAALVACFLLSYGLQILVHSLRLETFLAGAGLGFVCWLTFAVTHSLNTLWEGRKVVVLAINDGLFLVTYTVFGGVVAIWK